MTKRKNHSAEFKAKVALESIREEMTPAELSRKYGVHPNMISTRKRAVIANMAQAFERGKSDDAHAFEAEIDKLHSKISRNRPVKALWRDRQFFSYAAEAA